MLSRPLHLPVLLLSLCAISAAQSPVTITNVPDFFAQDLRSTRASKFDWVSPSIRTFEPLKLIMMQIAENFGLLPNDTTVPQWGEFKKEIARLNEEADEDVRYKVLFMARHGQGYHNTAVKFYGQEMWNVSYCIKITT